MKVGCPTCGRSTQIDSEIGDFPTRCQRCGGLLRRPAASATSAPSKRPRGLSLRLTAAPVCAPRGQLATILGARPGSDERPPPVIRARAPATIIEIPREPAPQDEILERRIRRTALRRAMLRGEIQTLGALGWLGLTLVASLAVVVLLLQVHAIWKHPRPLRADTLHADVP